MHQRDRFHIGARWIGLPVHQHGAVFHLHAVGWHFFRERGGRLAIGDVVLEPMPGACYQAIDILPSPNGPF